MKRSTDMQLRQARERYRRTDPRKRFAQRANRKVARYGRADDVLDWTALPAGPWACHACGVPCESWDHVEPLSLGGANQPHNLVASCLSCNQNRTAKSLRSLVPLIEKCKRGHDYTPENTRLGSRGERRCRGCARVYAVESYWRKRGVAA